MKNIFIAVGVGLAVIGLILMLGVLIAAGFDFSRLNTEKFVTNTHTPAEGFTDIDIRVLNASVILKPSEDGGVSVVCVENEKMRHTVSVESGTLCINVSDTRRFSDHIGVFSLGRRESVTVYLPESSYGALSVESLTGRVELPKEIGFDGISVSVKTASVVCRASAAGQIRLEAMTGSITVESVRAASLKLESVTGSVDVNSAAVNGSIDVSIRTGKLFIKDTECESLSTSGTTGRVTLENTVARGSMFIERKTGDINFIGVDAANITAKATTGDVSGSIRTEKVFSAKTTTGRVRVPDTLGGGACEITTTTGDINITIGG